METLVTSPLFSPLLSLNSSPYELVKKGLLSLYVTSLNIPDSLKNLCHVKQLTPSLITFQIAVQVDSIHMAAALRLCIPKPKFLDVKSMHKFMLSPFLKPKSASPRVRGSFYFFFTAHSGHLIHFTSCSQDSFTTEPIKTSNRGERRPADSNVYCT